MSRAVPAVFVPRAMNGDPGAVVDSEFCHMPARKKFVSGSRASNGGRTPVPP